MPLSEHEQRLLEEMERSLYQNDAEFVASVARVSQGRRSYTWLVAGILAGLAGVAILVLGVVVQQPLVGVLGFIVMFAGVLVALGSPRRPVGVKGTGAGRSSTSHPSAGRRPSAGFMDRMNDRWERRQNGDQS